MNAGLALEMLMKHRLYINGGPGPKGVMSFVVSDGPVDTFRGLGPTIPEAVEDWARQKWPKPADDDMGDLL